MTITHLYFDWSGTLAHPNTREIFLYGKTKKERLSSLYDDTIETLQYLKKKGYTIGIISNTSKPRNDIINSLDELGLKKYFKGSIVFSNDIGMCKKACKKIYQTALELDSVKPENAIMIGNNYKKDIVGSKKLNLNSIFVDRKRTYQKGISDIRINELKDLIAYL